MFYTCRIIETDDSRDVARITRACATMVANLENNRTVMINIVKDLISDMMGSDSFARVRKLLCKDLMHDLTFLTRLIENDEIIDTGKKLQFEYDDGDLIQIVLREKNLQALIFGLFLFQVEDYYLLKLLKDRQKITEVIMDVNTETEEQR